MRPLRATAYSCIEEDLTPASGKARLVTGFRTVLGRSIAAQQRQPSPDRRPGQTHQPRRSGRGYRPIAGRCPDPTVRQGTCLPPAGAGQHRDQQADERFESNNIITRREQLRRRRPKRQCDRPTVEFTDLLISEHEMRLFGIEHVVDDVSLGAPLYPCGQRHCFLAAWQPDRRRPSGPSHHARGAQAGLRGSLDAAEIPARARPVAREHEIREARVSRV
jgi:hypothetical protein